MVDVSSINTAMLIVSLILSGGSQQVGGEQIQSDYSMAPSDIAQQDSAHVASIPQESSTSSTVFQSSFSDSGDYSGYDSSYSSDFAGGEVSYGSEESYSSFKTCKDSEPGLNLAFGFVDASGQDTLDLNAYSGSLFQSGSTICGKLQILSEGESSATSCSDLSEIESFCKTDLKANWKCDDSSDIFACYCSSYLPKECSFSSSQPSTTSGLSYTPITVNTQSSFHSAYLMTNLKPSSGLLSTKPTLLTSPTAKQTLTLRSQVSNTPLVQTASGSSLPSTQTSSSSSSGLTSTTFSSSTSNTQTALTTGRVILGFVYYVTKL